MGQAGPPSTRRSPRRPAAPGALPGGAVLALVEDRDPGRLISWVTEYHLAVEGDAWTAWARHPDGALLDRAIPGWSLERLGPLGPATLPPAEAARRLAALAVMRRRLAEPARLAASDDRPRFVAHPPLEPADLDAAITDAWRPAARRPGEGA